MTKTEVLDILGREISFIQVQEKKPGWSKWALLTAIISIFLFLISQIEKGNSSYQTIIDCLLLCVITFDTLFIFKNVLFLSFRNDLSNNLSNNRFNSSLDYDSSRAITISLILKTVLIVYLFIHTTLGISIILYIIYILLILSLMLNLLGELFSLPVRKNYEFSKTFKIIIPIVSTIIGFFLLNFLFKSFTDLMPRAIILPNLKIALSVFAVGYLCLLLIKIENRQNLLFLKLNDIRRNLDFDKIKPEDALEQADIFIYGRKASHIFQHIIYDLMSSLEKVNKNFNKIELILAEIESSENFSTLNSKSLVQQKMPEINKYIDENLSELDVIEKRNKKLNKYLYIISKVSPESMGDDVALVIQKVSDMVIKTKQGSSDLKKHADKIINGPGIEIQQNK